MATTLPAATDYTGASVTQGGKKTFMTSLRTYLSDLFGTTSDLPTAHAAFKNYDASTLHNVGLAASVATNALTVALKTAGGADPSATDPVMIGMRSSTITSGVANLRNVAAAQSITIPSTATLGQTDGVPARLWLAEIDNAGTLEMAIINTQLGNGQIHPVNESQLISTTAIGTGSDSAGVWYSTAARSNVPFRLIGYIENTQASAGTWATSPSVLQPMGPGVRRPGEVVQVAETFNTSVATGTTIIPNDDTAPQITEGTQWMTQAITPTSAINALRIDAIAHMANNTTSGTMIAALFQDATAGALAVGLMNVSGVDVVAAVPIRHSMRSGTTSSTTFRVRGGFGVAATVTFNGFGGGRKMGGVLNSYMTVTEVMA